MADRDTELEVANIGVAPVHQGQGFGRMLLTHAESVARSKNYSRIWLFTSVENVRAFGFYKRLGYVFTKTVDNYDGFGEQGQLLVKDLD